MYGVVHGGKFKDLRVRSAKFTDKYFDAIAIGGIYWDKNPVDIDCGCYTCQNHTRAYLHHLFTTKELLYYHLATYHNVFYITNLMKQIRGSIIEGVFKKFKSQWLDKGEL